MRLAPSLRGTTWAKAAFLYPKQPSCLASPTVVISLARSSAGLGNRRPNSARAASSFIQFDPHRSAYDPKHDRVFASMQRSNE